MGASCFIIPTCQNPEGKHVESKLFEDLWRLSGDYKWAEQQYKIATDKEFLDAVVDGAVFDKNGQITARSFMDITGVTFASDEIKKRLSERWEDKSLPTEEVSSRVAEFNSSEELKDDFVPAVEEEGEVVKFTISQRTPARVAELQSFIENHETLKLVAKRLKDLGVAYDFVGPRSYKGRYSTQNAEKAYDDMYHLIEIVDGADVEATLIEESAHFATLACKDSTFINRLLNAINERTVNSLFSEDELEGVDLDSPNAKLELAGKLVAKAMKNELTQYKGLLGNIKRMIYNIFSKVNLASLVSDRAKAMKAAEQLARGFLTGNNMDVNIAIRSPQELFSSEPLTMEGKKLRDVIDKIRRLGARVKTINGNTYNAIYAKLSKSALLEVKDAEDFNSLTTADTIALMGSATTVLLERLAALAEPLAGIDKTFFEKEVSIDSLNDVYEADSVWNTLDEILRCYNELGVNPKAFDDASLTAMHNMVNEIKTTLDKYKDSLDNFKFLYSAQLMREVCGRENIDMAADIHLEGFKPVQRAGRSYTMEQVVSFYYDEITDTNPYLTIFRTYSNHRDVTTQAFYNIVRQTKAKEAILYNDRVDELIGIEEQWKEYRKTHRGASTLMFYERLEDGSLSGSFRSEYRWGKYYADEAELRKRLKKVFAEELEGEGVTAPDGSTIKMDEFKRLTKIKKWKLFNGYIESHPAYQQFLSLAFKDKEHKELSDNYVDQDFRDLYESDSEFREIYDKIIKYKNLIDAKLLTDNCSGGASHGKHMRVPQFPQRGVAKLFNNNKKLIVDRDLYDSRTVKTMCEDVTSDFFGSPITEELKLEGHKLSTPPDLRKLALYGINLLKDPNSVSTDIFKTLELYTEMACRFNTSQAIASKLELFHSQLRNREVTESISGKFRGIKKGLNAEKTATEKRESILENFVYAKHPINWGDRGAFMQWLRRTAVKAAGVLGAFAAIRALCISPIAGLKNYVAGYRVLAQDVRAGVLDGVTMKDVLKATWKNMSLKHQVGEVGRLLYGETMTFDHYQRLIDRWDSYRTPSKIHRKKGFSVLQMIVNMAMANYSLTDNALIGTIYYSKLNNVKLYDAVNSKWVSAADAYEWKKDKPMIREGLLMDAGDTEEYRKIRAALEAARYIQKNNSDAESNLDMVPLTLYDSAGDPLRELEDFYESLDENTAEHRVAIGKSIPSFKKGDGSYKNLDDVIEELQKAADQLCFNEDSEFKICGNINDYIISSQGVYGMLNATEFQSGVYTQSLGKIKGYMFGILQRNFLNNYRITNNQMNHSVFEAYGLALWSVFSNAKELSALDDTGITPWQYRKYTLALMCLPPSFRSQECIDHMRRCGWDPDQLEKIASVAIGFWINLTLSIISRMLYRGNQKAIGTKVYSAKGKMPLDKAKLDGLITMFSGQRHRKLIKPGVLFPKETISIDPKAEDQLERWSNTKPDAYRKNYRKPEEGHFIPGTRAFDDRVESFELKNIVYDTQDPRYFWAGVAYRFARGVRDEGVTLMNPLRYVNDFYQMTQFGNSIVVSGGLGVLYKAIQMIQGEDMREKFLDREINFYLNKLGFTYDSTPDAGMPEVQLLDWYGKQEVIDRYNDQDRLIWQPWN